MIDAVQDFRISALERALASLTGGDAASHAGHGQSVTNGFPIAAADNQQAARIASLEGAIVALSNSVTLLNQQMASLSTELQKQTDASHMITITPTATVDSAQDARLDDIDTLVKTLSQNVADYNNQMASLIAQYQSLHKRPKAKPNGFGINTP